LGLWFSGLLVLLQWIYSTQTLDWRSALSVFSVLVAGLLLYGYCGSTANGMLTWDGVSWRWESETAELQPVFTEQSISILADFQRLLILTTSDNAGNRRWLFARMSVFPDQWLDFRRAAYCLQKTSTTPIQIDTERE
jgi:hypothetical protein